MGLVFCQGEGLLDCQGEGLPLVLLLLGVLLQGEGLFAYLTAPLGVVVS